MSQDTNQKERIPEALHPDFFRVDERSLHDLYLEAQKLAGALNFYESTEKEATTSWSAFFEEVSSYLNQLVVPDEMNSSMEYSGHCPPHLGLFLAFLKLFQYNQSRLNELTSAHLNFFYQKILKQEKREMKPDKVFVFFGLARNTKQYLLPRRSSLLAGKDARGNAIIYTTDRELSINHAKVAWVMAIHHSQEKRGSIYAFPMANRREDTDTPLEGPGWHPFGNIKNRQTSAIIGFGIGSPILLLNEGVRLIQLSFSIIKSEDESRLSQLNSLDPEAFEVHLTGPDQWFSKEVQKIQFEEDKLRFTIQLTEIDPPVIAFDKKIHLDAMSSMDWPMVKIVFKDGFSYDLYDLFQSVFFTRFSIKVDVEKARNLILSNDYGNLDANKAFQPFGYSPVVGANLYMGMEETFQKPISAYAISIKWKGLPENFKTYYEGYLGETNSLVRSEKDFKIKMSLRLRRTWVELDNDNASPEFSLFDPSLHLNLEYLSTEYPDISRRSTSENGLIRLTLSSPQAAFGHSLYPSVYAKAIMGQLMDRPSPIPNEPYTPIIDSVELSYTSEENYDLTKAVSSSFRFFHIEPFGIKENILKENGFYQSSLVSNEFQQAGNLYLGIENLHPPQQLTLFFDIAEGNIKDKPEIFIHFLGKKGWTPLSESDILSDSTLGLKQSGIINVNLPSELTSLNPSMPLEYHWLRLSVSTHPQNVANFLSVRTNAVSCTLNYQSFLQGLEVNTLPSGSIKGFSRKIADIKLIEQPYSSFGGRPEETKTHFFTRVSEKMRHKMRAISSWDFERLILEQFPEIYKVKCIAHANSDGRQNPGNIHIIVIPIIRNNQSFVLKPMVSKGTLSEIKEYIRRLASPHAEVNVTNPDYEEIKIAAAINFHVQMDAGFYIKQLQNDLQRFLSPWAFNQDVDIHLGNKLYRSSVIAFIESRHYINFITNIKLLKNNKVVHDHELSTDEKTIIVSAETHKIEAIGQDRVLCQTNQGIEQMIVDVNFEIQ